MDTDNVCISEETFEREFRGVPIDSWEEFIRRAGSQSSESSSLVLTWIGVILLNTAITTFISFATIFSWQVGLCFTVAYGIALLVFLLRPSSLQKHIAVRIWPLIPLIVGIVGAYLIIAFDLVELSDPDKQPIRWLLIVLTFTLIPHLVCAILCLWLIQAPPLWINIFFGTWATLTATAEQLHFSFTLILWCPFALGVVGVVHYVLSLRRTKRHPYDVWILHLGAAFYCFGLLGTLLDWPFTFLLLLPLLCIGIASDRCLVLLIACIGICTCCFQMAHDAFQFGGAIGSSLAVAVCGSSFIFFAMQYSAHAHKWRSYLLTKFGSPHLPLQSELLIRPEHAESPAP